MLLVGVDWAEAHHHASSLFGSLKVAWASAFVANAPAEQNRPSCQ